MRQVCIASLHELSGRRCDPFSADFHEDSSGCYAVLDRPAISIVAAGDICSWLFQVLVEMLVMGSMSCWIMGDSRERKRGRKQHSG